MKSRIILALIAASFVVVLVPAPASAWNGPECVGKPDGTYTKMTEEEFNKAGGEGAGLTYPVPAEKCVPPPPPKKCEDMRPPPTKPCNPLPQPTPQPTPTPQPQPQPTPTPTPTPQPTPTPTPTPETPPEEEDVPGEVAPKEEDSGGAPAPKKESDQPPVAQAKPVSSTEQLPYGGAPTGFYIALGSVAMIGGYFLRRKISLD